MSELVKLKNGSEELGPLVSVTMSHLKALMNEGKDIVVYELAEICKDSNHKPWGTAIGKDLRDLKLAEEDNGRWHVHNSIRNIVLSAVEGEGLDLTIVDPIVEGA